MKTCTKCAEAIQVKARVFRYIGISVVVGVLMACHADTNESQESMAPVVAEPQDKDVYFASAPAESNEKQGARIAVWSDRKTSYTDEGSGVLANGNL